MMLIGILTKLRHSQLFFKESKLIYLKLTISYNLPEKTGHWIGDLGGRLTSSQFSLHLFKPFLAILAPSLSCLRSASPALPFLGVIFMDHWSPFNCWDGLLVCCASLTCQFPLLHTWGSMNFSQSLFLNWKVNLTAKDDLSNPSGGLVFSLLKTVARGNLGFRASAGKPWRCSCHQHSWNLPGQGCRP